MNTMIDRMANAIFAAMDISDSLTPTEATRYAAAALEAMMEPTEAMVMSQGKSKPENAATETQRERAEALNRSVRRLAVEMWREMIQAALKEGQ